MGNAMVSLGKGLGQALTGQSAAPSGPVVRIARGNNVTTVPVGGR
jgi:pilus assembly protein CpaB